MAFVLIDEEEDTLPTPGQFELIDEELPSPSQKIVSGAIGAGLGGIQGGVDLAQLASLGLYPLEKGIQHAFGQQGQPAQLTPGHEARIMQEQNVLERLNRGEKPSWLDLMLLESEDELLPLRGSGTSLESVNQMADAIPETGDIQEISRRTSRSLPFLLGGPAAFYSSLRGEMAGLGARRAAESLGASEGAATVADILGGVGGSILGAKKLAPVSAQRILHAPTALRQEGGLFAKAEIQAGRKSLEKNIQKIDQNAIQQWEDNVSKISKKSFNEFPEFQASEIAQDVIQGNKTKILDRISPASNEQQAWRGVQQAIEQAFEKEAAIYRPLYTEVREGAKNLSFSPRNTIKALEEGLNRLTQISTQAPGYAQSETILKTALSDLGRITIPISRGARMVDAFGRPLEMKAAQINQSIPVSHALELKTRLNDIRNYENLTPTIKDQVLDPILKSLRQEIRTGLSQNPKLETAFNKAESLYQNTAKRFSKDVIQDVRKTETPETLTNAFLKPSNIESLKAVLSPQEMNLAERQIVERIIQQNTDSAQQSLNQIERLISPQAKQAAKEGIDLGNNLTSAGQRQIWQRRLLEDVQKSVTTGERPEFLLNSMKTQEGYQLSKDLFKNSQKGRELFKAAERQVMADVFDSIITQEGRIDWKKASGIFRDPQVRKVIKDIGGAESVTFLDRLSTYGYNIGKNLERYGAKNQDWVKGLLATLSSPTKVFLGGLLGIKFGVPQVAAAAAGAQLLNKAFMKILSKPSAQRIIRQLANPDSYSQIELKSLMARLNEYLMEGESNGTQQQAL